MGGLRTLVFVEYYNGMPFGRVLAEVCESRARAAALVVQALPCPPKTNEVASLTDPNDLVAM